MRASASKSPMWTTKARFSLFKTAIKRSNSCSATLEYEVSPITPNWNFWFWALAMPPHATQTMATAIATGKIVRCPWALHLLIMVVTSRHGSYNSLLLRPNAAAQARVTGEKRCCSLKTCAVTRRLQRLVMHCLHELATPECRHILPPKLEPLTVLPSFYKPLMPVSLNSDGIIGLDCVYCNDWLRKLDGKLVFSAPGSVTAANLVILSGFEQIDVPDRRCCFIFNRGLIGFVTSC